MSVSSLPATIRFGTCEEPFWLEFDRRIGIYSMRNNHYHTEFELYYLFSGERNYFIKDSVHQIQPGDVVLIDSNALHKTSQRGEPNHERIVLYYTPSFLAGFSQMEQELLLASFSHSSPLLKLNLQEKLQVESLLLAMLNELVEQPLGYSVRVRNIAIELLLLSARHIQKKAPPPEEEPSPVQRKMTDVVRHINLHYGSSLQLEEIARQFYISKSHLSRIFKKVTGFGFAEYVNITRVKEAERLLRDTDASVTQVAEQCGFESLTHFGKVFKALSGLSPRDYRKLGQPTRIPPKPE
ncbi:MAG: AraC family transcriptional regulator [Paenibacillaceae bacterium]|jgi:AraC-like DNA-binding protein|nr:AraC family transcriptional regulator [Paenibacillaceae bacterium]